MLYLNNHIGQASQIRSDYFKSPHQSVELLLKKNKSLFLYHTINQFGHMRYLYIFIVADTYQEVVCPFIVVCEKEAEISRAELSFWRRFIVKNIPRQSRMFLDVLLFLTHGNLHLGCSSGGPWRRCLPFSQSLESRSSSFSANVSVPMFWAMIGNKMNPT